MLLPPKSQDQLSYQEKFFKPAENHADKNVTQKSFWVDGSQPATQVLVSRKRDGE
jgi:hypothetical protein